ncbi:MAG: dolichol-phosphate mannosyltransferase [Cyanobacteriota bacterium]|nr:dolichol-phosphate mannosyltransferase [Cyanobacteriota bacterium]
MISSGDYFSWVIILAGILYSLYLCWQVPKDVFFNGDGALKALLAQQISRGQMRFDLVNNPALWLHQLWKKGLYPYKEPFVFRLNQRYYISFPFPFSLLTSLFYRLFGYRGFYFVPLASTWIIWLSFYWAGRALQLSGWGISFGLLLLIFASPLTFYSAMYWEHTLAVALSFMGIAVVFFTPENWPGIIQILLGGFLVGSSVWFRSELLAMVVALVLLTGLGLFLDPSFTIIKSLSDGSTQNLANWSMGILENKRIIFCAGMIWAVGFFWICNKLVYGRFLGIHSLLVLNEFSWKRRIKEAFESFKQLNTSYFRYFPIAFFPTAYLLAFLVQKGIGIGQPKWAIFSLSGLLLSLTVLMAIFKGISQLKFLIKKRGLFLISITGWSYFLLVNEVQVSHQMWIVYLLYVSYTIGVSCLVDFAPGEEIVGGKQWGPRYLLILMPFTTLLTVKQLQVLWSSSNFALTYSSFAFALILLGMGCYQNIYFGFQYFYKAHEGIAPALDALRQSSHQIIACSHQYAAQALAFSLSNEKSLLCVENHEAMIELGTTLVEHNRPKKMIYVRYPYRPCSLIEEKKGDLLFTHNEKKFQIKLTQLGQFGRYPLYEADILPAN